MLEKHKRKICRWQCRDRVLTSDGRPLVMGILNVTPDSFSDGGRFCSGNDALEHGLRMQEEGADIIDVGGESTRPNAPAVSAEDEMRRVVPIIERLSSRIDAAISVDTMKASVARAAIDAGAVIVNDVSALTHDPAMTEVALQTGAGVVLMHMQGSPRTMQADPHYDDVVREVCDYLESRVGKLVEAGLNMEALVVDPGVGFGKTLKHNLKLLANLAEIRIIGRPVVVGLSRKSMLGMLTDRPVEERLAGSIAGLVFSVLNGADVVRVHDVKETVDAVRVATALTQAQEKEAQQPRA